MSELDLFNLSRSISQNEISLFTQVITINFAMVVGLYYFLHRALTAMKVFAFAVYLVGMLLFLGKMLLETSVAFEAQREMKALPHLSPMTMTSNFMARRLGAKPKLRKTLMFHVKQ
jgi:hypothetical protein